MEQAVEQAIVSIGVGYESRKDQINAFIRQAKLPLETPEEKKRFYDAMRSACMVGACEERSHCLKILRRHGLTGPVRDICKTPVLEVLGFEKEGDDDGLTPREAMQELYEEAQRG